MKTNVSLLNLHFTKSGPLKMSQDFSSQVFFSIWQFTWWQVFKTFLTSLNPCSGCLWWLNLALHGRSPVRRWNRFSFDGELFASGLMWWEKTSVMISKDRDLRQEHRRIYMYTRLTLPEWPIERNVKELMEVIPGTKQTYKNQHSSTQSLRRQTVSMHSRKRTENTWHKWIWVTYESYVWKSANMKSERELKLKLHFSDFQICLSIHLEAHPKHQEPEPYLAISRLQQQNEYGHTLHCKLRGFKVSTHATWKRNVDIEDRPIERTRSHRQKEEF